MPPKTRARPLSGSRQRRQNKRRSSLTIDHKSSELTVNQQLLEKEPDLLYSDVDFRSTKEKIASLEKELQLKKNDESIDERLDALVLIQLYTELEYGEKSVESARAYLNLSKFYLHQKNLLPQAKSHILKAHQIIEQLNIKPADDNLAQALLGFEIYLLLVQCSLYAKKYMSQRDIKPKNKHIASIDTTDIDHDLNIIQEYLERLKHLMSSADYDEKHIQYLLAKFGVITSNVKDFNSNVSSLIDQIIQYYDKNISHNSNKHKIDIYLRTGSYFINFTDQIPYGLHYYEDAVHLAEDAENKRPSKEHKRQLANANFQLGKAKIRSQYLGEATERKLKRAIELYRQANDENDTERLKANDENGIERLKLNDDNDTEHLNVNDDNDTELLKAIDENDIELLKAIDELIAYYMKTDNFKDAAEQLADSLPEKRRLFGDFSEETIETQSRLGAVYLVLCEYIPATENLKECLDLQEFVYGPKDPRTCQTRDTLEILKKNPRLPRSLFVGKHDGACQDRPAFSFSSKVCHEKEDHELLLTVTKKPPICSKN